MKLHKRYLRNAKELYIKGNLTQASKKYWGAVTAPLNTIGEKEAGATTLIEITPKL